MDGREISLWDKVVLEPASGEEQEQEPGEERSRVREGSPADRVQQMYGDPKWAWKRRGLDLISTIFWLYAFIKLFIYDVDQALVEALVPGVEWIVDLRFFLIIFLLAVLVLALRPRSLLLAAIYVLFFPLIVLFWKVPKRLIKTRSWVAAFAVMNALATVITNVRYVLVASAVFLLSSLAVAALHQDAVLAIAAIALATLLTSSLARTIWLSLRPSRFIRAQERGIERALNSKRMASLTSADEEWQRRDLVLFNDTQQQQFLLKVATSATVYRALYFWGYQLDQYRKSPAGLLYSALSYIWLLAQSVVSLTLINLAVYKADASSYAFDDGPNLFEFARYSFASLIGNEISALQAESSLANAISLVSMFIGIGLFAGLLITIVLSFRRERQDAAVRQSLRRIDALAQDLDARHKESFELSIRDTIAKLEELGYALARVCTFFADRVPRDWRPTP